MSELEAQIGRFMGDLLDEAPGRTQGVPEIVHEGRRRRRRRAAASRAAASVIGLVAVVALATLVTASDPDVGLAPAAEATDASAGMPGTDGTGPGVVRGALPDGRPFTLTVRPGRDLQPEGITGVVVAVAPDGTATALGETTWRRAAPPPVPTIQGGRLRVGAGDWTMDVVLYEEIDQEALQASLPRWRTRSEGGLPVVDPPDGYRLSRDDDVPVEQAIHYPGFSVVEGCDPDLGRCAPGGHVMVIPADPRDGLSSLHGLTIR